MVVVVVVVSVKLSEVEFVALLSAAPAPAVVVSSVVVVVVCAVELVVLVDVKSPCLKASLLSFGATNATPGLFARASASAPPTWRDMTTRFSESVWLMYSRMCTSTAGAFSAPTCTF